ncbi:MAG TPA: hypothetical protein VIN40_00540 [Candidatus Tyrphobacter sp.]
MTETASALTAWSSFYVMIGSAAAALTGLMFVVITLVNRVERTQNAPDGIATFSTPTVAHFSVALLVSAILSAPWHAMVYPAVLLGLIGLCGVAYLLRLLPRTKRLSSYSPDVEDWIWYSILPLIAGGAILVGAIMLFAKPVQGLFAIAGGVVLLIFIGIRNAWDVVTYITIGPGKP